MADFQAENVRMLVFDAGGTLIHPDPPVPVVYAHAAARYGIQVSAADLDRKFREAFQNSESVESTGKLGGESQRTSEAAELQRWRWIVRECLGDFAGFDDCFAELFAWFARPEAWACYPDVRPALARFQAAGWTMGLASNFDARLHAICAATPELARLNPRWISSEVGYRKPAPEFFAAIGATCGYRPGELLMIGDDPIADVAGARAAGWQAVLIDRKSRHGSNGFSSLAELADLLAVVL